MIAGYCFPSPLNVAITLLPTEYKVGLLDTGRGLAPVIILADCTEPLVGVGGSDGRDLLLEEIWGT